MLLRIIAWVLGFATLFIGSVGLVQRDSAPRAAIVLSCIYALAFGSLALCRWSRPQWGARFLVGGFITIIAISALAAGGVRSPGTGFFVVFVLMAGLLMGERAGTVTAIICILIGLALLTADLTGTLPAASVTYSPTALWILGTMYIVIVVALQRMAARVVTRSLARAESELAHREQVVAQLKERVKELRVIHSVASLLQRDRPVDQGLLDAFVALIPGAWLHDDVCVARVTYADLVAESPNWETTPWMIFRSFATTSGTVEIQVGYLEERPLEDNGPFLKEELELLGSLTEMLGTFVERRDALERRSRAERQLRQSQKMQALGTLAGGIAHDFNNLLSAILANAEFGSQTTVDPIAREHFAEVERASLRAADLVRSILVFSRQHHSNRAPLAIGPVVEEAVRLLQATHTDVRVETKIASEVPLVLADATQVHQIIMNLGTNGTHAMKERARRELMIAVDPITLDARDLDGLADLRAGSYVRLTVTDTGAGMTREVQERLFEPFFTTKGDAGTGLGLSMVHGIVGEHEGAITVHSELDRGTTFVIYLPELVEHGLTAASTPVVP